MKIFLVGIMGSGKSYWAQKLEGITKYSFVDLDHLVEESEGKTIAQIFAEHSEDYFRKKEAEQLRSFAEKNNFILSTGGGTPCFNNNMNWMNEHGITIWIDEDIDVLAKRLINEKAHRPLIKNLSDDELKTFLSNKLEERKKFYAMATHHVSKDEINKENFIKIIEQYV